ncbi:TonB-dependent receptor [Parabacteroides sp. FAFU027]|uniref:TonB-dependent receptor n=1 Tax=Parabacteroides sp. FAFU027 TaxID=2922715 RepID=UPI001FAFC719|nr:TonB-dependent receptor [Parabacteroides sp. FAFU027]
MPLRKLLILFFLFRLVFYSFSENQVDLVTLSGYVTDATNGQALVGATVRVKESETIITTNSKGFFAFALPVGSYNLNVFLVGYKILNQKVTLDKNKSITFKLIGLSSNLQELVVTTGRNDENVRNNMLGVHKLGIEEIRKIPAFMGEVDLLKVIQLLPGVSTVDEGTSSFIVRGGSSDQNLILLDEATVYNASHLMGFFSTFNNDAIKNLTLYKGDIPVLYDGRLSSLLDVRMKEGNYNKISGSGGVGPISSRIAIDGPLSNRTTFLIAARRTYADLFLKLSNEDRIKNNKLNFYDLNFKIDHQIDNNNRLYLSAYMGKDNFKTLDVANNYGNDAMSIRWNHLFSRRMSSNLSLMYSSYGYQLASTVSDDSNFDWKYKMRDFNIRYDFTHLHNSTSVKFGYQAVLHKFNPGTITSTGSANDQKPFILPENKSVEQAIYISNDFSLSQKINIKVGIRLNAFSNVGGTTVYKYDQNYNPEDSMTYGNNNFFNTYLRLSPRIGFRWQFNSNSSFKLNYSHTNQFLQMASNSTSGTPLDLWFTASPYVKPQTCDQYSFGFFRNFGNNTYETSFEVYYKKMKHTIDFRDHAQLLHNRLLEGELRFGNSEAIGSEFLFQKTKGKTTGWISYSYSKSTRTIKDINKDQSYYSPYDRPHTVYVIVNQELKKNLSCGATFIFSSGRPITYPIARMEFDKLNLPVYSDRNAYRMPEYHRLDLAMTWEPISKRKHFWNGEWNFSIYNVYARKNAWTINFVNYRKAGNDSETRAEMTYLYSIIPSVTYNFKF